MQILAHSVTDPSQTSATTGAPGGTSSGTTPPAANSPDQLTNEGTFLHLLVAQIQNQDPLNPTDAIQFVGQLVQFSQLEQLLEINKDIQTLVGSGTGSTPTTPTPPAGTGSNKIQT